MLTGFVRTVGRVTAVVSLLFAAFSVGVFVTSVLPTPSGRYIFTPANEVGAGALLFLVSGLLAFWRWPR